MNSYKEMIQDVSIIICSHNGEKTITECLNSLNNQKLVDDRNIQIILIDSGSSDSTFSLMNEYRESNQKLNFHIDVFQLQQPGQSLAINFAIKHALSDVLLFTDDDCILDSRWIKSYYDAFFSTEGASYYFGRIIPRAESIFPTWWTLTPRSLSGRDQGDATKIYNYFSKESYPIGCNMAINKRILYQNNLFFDENIGPSPLNKIWLGADSKLGFQFIQFGGFCSYVPEAIIYHCIKANRIKFRYIIRHNFISGRASFYYRNEHRGIAGTTYNIIVQFLRMSSSLLLLNFYKFKRHLLKCTKEVGYILEVFKSLSKIKKEH